MENLGGKTSGFMLSISSLQLCGPKTGPLGLPFLCPGVKTILQMLLLNGKKSDFKNISFSFPSLKKKKI